MNRFLKVVAAPMLLATPGLATAQTDTPQTTPAAQAKPMSPQMMQMMQNCMGMMQTGMGGTTPMQDGASGTMAMQGNTQGNMSMQDSMPMMQGGVSEAMSVYMAAMSKMDAPMMQGVQAPDPDVAFVKGMIPHHQGAIDMARVELQYGDDETVKAWANQIIAAQEKEIAEMQDWLQAHSQ